MTISTITSTDLAAVSGGGEASKLGGAAFAASLAGMTSWATGYGAVLLNYNALTKGNAFAIPKHMSPRVDKITTGLGVLAGVSGAYLAGKYAYQHTK